MPSSPPRQSLPLAPILKRKNYYQTPVIPTKFDSIANPPRDVLYKPTNTPAVDSCEAHLLPRLSRLEHVLWFAMSSVSGPCVIPQLPPGNLDDRLSSDLRFAYAFESRQIFRPSPLTAGFYIVDDTTKQREGCSNVQK